MDVVNWFKENYKGKQIRRRDLKWVVRGLRHEAVHYKIYKKFDKEMELFFELNMIEVDPTLRYIFACHCSYPSVYELPAYYPIYIFIEFIHTIFDIIDGIIKFEFINVISSSKYFIRKIFDLEFNK